jgi:hypothetical protein
MAGDQGLSRAGAALMGAVFTASGGVVLALAAGLLPINPNTLEAPRCVLASVGAMFMAGGLVRVGMTFRLPDWVNQGVGLVAASGLAVVFNWIAFFPGPRHFRTSTSMLGIPLVRGAGGEVIGRAIFGMFALLIDVI